MYCTVLFRLNKIWKRFVSPAKSLRKTPALRLAYFQKYYSDRDADWYDLFLIWYVLKIEILVGNHFLETINLIGVAFFEKLLAGQSIDVCQYRDRACR